MPSKRSSQRRTSPTYVRSHTFVMPRQHHGGSLDSLLPPTGGASPSTQRHSTLPARRLRRVLVPTTSHEVLVQTLRRHGQSSQQFVGGVTLAAVVRAACSCSARTVLHPDQPPPAQAQAPRYCVRGAPCQRLHSPRRTTNAENPSPSGQPYVLVKTRGSPAGVHPPVRFSQHGQLRERARRARRRWIADAARRCRRRRRGAHPDQGARARILGHAGGRKRNPTDRLHRRTLAEAERSGARRAPRGHAALGFGKVRVAPPRWLRSTDSSSCSDSRHAERRSRFRLAGCRSLRSSGH